MALDLNFLLSQTALLNFSDQAPVVLVPPALSWHLAASGHVGGVCFVAAGDTSGSDAVWIGDILHRVDADAMASQVGEETKIMVVQQQHNEDASGF